MCTYAHGCAHACAQLNTSISLPMSLHIHTQVSRWPRRPGCWPKHTSTHACICVCSTCSHYTRRLDVLARVHTHSHAHIHLQVPDLAGSSQPPLPSPAQASLRPLVAQQAEPAVLEPPSHPEPPASTSPPRDEALAHLRHVAQLRRQLHDLEEKHDVLERETGQYRQILDERRSAGEVALPEIAYS